MLSQRSGTIRRLDDSLGAVCADIAAGAHEIAATDVDTWLTELASMIAEEHSAPAVASIAILEPVGGSHTWETHHFGLAGAPRPEIASTLEREARAGFPHDDLSFHAGHRGESPRPACGTRRSFVGDDRWFGSGYAAFRRPLGLHDFARAVVPLREMEGDRTLIVQLDLLRTDVSAQDRGIGLVGGVAPAIVRAYHTRFVAIREHREAVKDRLTPAQRRVIPFLVEGLSETQVAAAVGRSAHTVHDHTKTIYQSLGVSNRLQLRDLWFGRKEMAGRRREADNDADGSGGGQTSQ